MREECDIMSANSVGSDVPGDTTLGSDHLATSCRRNNPLSLLLECEEDDYVPPTKQTRTPTILRPHVPALLRRRAPAKSNSKLVVNHKSNDTSKHPIVVVPRYTTNEKVPLPFKNPTKLACFRIFFSSKFISRIVNRTNEFLKFSTNSRPELGTASVEDLTLKEFMVFLGLSLLMPHVLKQSLDLYWTECDLRKTVIFSEYMSHERYLLLLNMLQFDDKNVPRTDDNCLDKLDAIISHLRSTFLNCFNREMNISIQNNPRSYKGKLVLKEFMPNKQSRACASLFVLCDNETGYVLDFAVYKVTEAAVLPGENDLDLVASLLHQYLDVGHVIYMAGWQNSPSLFTWLYKYIHHHLEVSLEEMPILEKQLKLEGIQFYSFNKLLTLKWCDNGGLWVLSSSQCSEITETGNTELTTTNEIVKPNEGVICTSADYNDMLLSGPKENIIQWYNKIFFYLLDLSVLNAKVFYGHFSKTNIPFASFHIELIREMLGTNSKEEKECRRDGEDTVPRRLTGRHFLSITDDVSSRGKRLSRRCYVCTGNGIRKEIVTLCKPCGKYLCVPCFEIYHTKKSF